MHRLACEPQPSAPAIAVCRYPAGVMQCMLCSVFYLQAGAYGAPSWPATYLHQLASNCTTCSTLLHTKLTYMHVCVNSHERIEKALKRCLQRQPTAICRPDAIWTARCHLDSQIPSGLPDEWQSSGLTDAWPDAGCQMGCQMHGQMPHFWT